MITNIKIDGVALGKNTCSKINKALLEYRQKHTLGVEYVQAKDKRDKGEERLVY